MSGSGTGQPIYMGPPITLRAPISIRSERLTAEAWAHEQQGHHRCQCGCGRPIEVQPHRRWRGIPRTSTAARTGLATGECESSGRGLPDDPDVCRPLGIGFTTYCRCEGRVLPEAKRDAQSGIRIFRRRDFAALRRAWQRFRRFPRRAAVSGSPV